MQEEHVIHHDIETLYKLADLFKIFSDSTRIRILDILIKGELCVQDIADALEMPINTVKTKIRRAKAQLLKMMEYSDELL